MKFYLVVFVAVLMTISVQSYAQRISIKKQTMSLQRVFKEIRKQTKYDFIYNSDILKGARPVEVHLQNSTVNEALDSVLAGNSLHYTIEDKVVMITAKEVFTQLKPIGYAISGVVTNKQGEPLSGANILLGGYQIRATADSAGRFEMRGLRPGNYNLLVQMVGYTPHTENIIITNKARNVEMILEESIKVLTEVVVRPDPYRSQYLATFKENFIGTSPNAKKCVILNPQVLRFEYDREEHILRATADEFLIIENKVLGYTVKYFLRFFEKDDETNVVHFSGYPYFEEIAKRSSQMKRYEKPRKRAYIGSPQHFFRALFHNVYQEQGFFINKLVKAPNSRKRPDNVIDERIKLLSEKKRNRKEERKRKESLNYWTKMKLLPDTVEVLIREEVPWYTLVRQKVSSLKTLDFEDALYIIFIKEHEPRDYTKYSKYKIERPEDFLKFQISLLYPLKASPGFYENGALHDPESLLFEGIWAYEKVADMLPVDYQPDKVK